MEYRAFSCGRAGVGEQPGRMRPRAAVGIMKSRPRQTIDTTINFKGYVDIKTHQNVYGAAVALFRAGRASKTREVPRRNSRHYSHRQMQGMCDGG